jgi:L-cysteine:1D-myo-inositol 2-amino-2-deoxy-alpha-D-glucopyranoside ligase
MRLYNALTRKKENIEAADDTLTVYVCGITPYDTTHLGHGFTYATFDVLIRYLESRGHKVRYVQNVTDVDDDILRRAIREGRDWRALGNQWTRHFIDDNQDLNFRPPDYFPRATDVIVEIIDNVKELLRKGVAYESAGSVYFQIKKDRDFGQLSRLGYQEMLPIANERGNKPDDPNKHDPLDFVLWQAAAPGEPTWESPWGPGRPGWHIECSTLSSLFLGLPIDIHGGGADLIFPHHECEIAQAEYACGSKPFTRFWMHVAMVRYQGEKMSKSLGNMIMVRDLLNEGYGADAIRLLFARFHYREAWTYRELDLQESVNLARILKAASRAEKGNREPIDTETYNSTFYQAMNDDLNTPAALRSMAQLADDILSAANEHRGIARAQSLLMNQCSIFGLGLAGDQAKQRVIDGWNRHRQNFVD